MRDLMKILCTVVIAAGPAAWALVGAPPAASAQEDLRDLQAAYRNAAEKAAPAVVQLRIERTGEPQMPAQRSGAQRPAEYNKRPDTPASGVVIGKEGWILTSLFNMRGDIESITVVTTDGRELEAQLIGSDANKDVALLQADVGDEPLKAIPQMEGRARVGQFAVVVGRGGRDPTRHSLTAGIVSARNRMRGEVLQVDALINWGNLGGAVVNLDGELVGIACHTHGGLRHGLNSGVGFCVPVTRMSEVIDDLKAGKRISIRARPFMGIQADQDASAERTGVVLGTILDGTAAQKAGLKVGDAIISINGVEITAWETLVYEINRYDAGETVTIVIGRMMDGEEWTQELDLTLGSRAEYEAQQNNNQPEEGDEEEEEDE